MAIDKRISKDIAKLLHVKIARPSENGKIKSSKTPLEDGTLCCGCSLHQPCLTGISKE